MTILEANSVESLLIEPGRRFARQWAAGFMRYSYADPVWVYLWAGYEDAYQAVLPKYEKFASSGGNAISPVGLYYAWRRGDSNAFWQLAASPNADIWTLLAAGADARRQVSTAIETMGSWTSGALPMITARMGQLAWELACWHEENGGASVLEALERLLDWAFNSALMANSWQSVRLWDGGWRRSNENGAAILPELGPLVAPAYAYLAKATGERRWLEMADTQIHNALMLGNFWDMRNWHQLMLRLGWYYKWREEYVERGPRYARESLSNSDSYWYGS